MVQQSIYEISVKTANIKDAGTDELVWLIISNGNAVLEMQLGNPNVDDFERGHTDVYRISGTHFETIDNVGIKFKRKWDNDDYEWKPEWIKVTNLTNGFTREAIFDQWIADDGIYWASRIIL